VKTENQHGTRRFATFSIARFRANRTTSAGGAGSSAGRCSGGASARAFRGDEPARTLGAGESGCDRAEKEHAE
jgi:hypothetical protein